MNREAKFEDLVGQTLTSIEGLESGSDVVTFRVADGRVYRMYHSQDCCESVAVEDVSGDVSDLIGTPVLAAVESTNVDQPPPDSDRGDVSGTWTFYRLTTSKGLVVIRWLGESNGYYSESVDFEETMPERAAPVEVKRVANWKPYGKLVLVELHKRGSALDLSASEVTYNGLATIVAVGPDVVGLNVGEVVMVNGPQGIVAHKELGENRALIPAPLVLAVRLEEMQ